MTWLWIALGVLAALAGVRYRHRLAAGRRTGGRPRVDDDAVRRIIEEGSIDAGGGDDVEPLDLDEAARAEEEFWEESWDDPEEFRP